MKCKHNLLISKCDPCLSKTLAHLIKTSSSSYSSSSSSCKEEKKCKKCYANAYIITSNQSLPPVIRTFTQEELLTDCGVEVQLTSSCSNSLLEVGKCKSPENKWCRIIDRENLFVTSIQVPKGCGGCYSYDLSASVALMSELDLSVIFTIQQQTLVLSLSTQVPIPAIVDLRLSEQLPREVCVADEISETPESCFTAVTFPLLDTASATETLGGLDPNILLSLFILTGVVNLLTGVTGIVNLNNGLFNQNFKFSNLNINGIVCLRDCQRLVPTVTIRKIDIFEIFQSSLPANATFSFSNIKLYLSGLSLKLVRLNSCPETCQCKL